MMLRPRPCIEPQVKELRRLPRGARGTKPRLKGCKRTIAVRSMAIRHGCRALEKEAQVRHRVETVMVIPGEQVESSRLIAKEIRSASPLRKDQSDLAVSLVHNRGRIAASFALAPIQTPNASRRAVERGRARRATRSDRRMIPCLCKKLERGKMHG